MNIKLVFSNFPIYFRTNSLIREKSSPISARNLTLGKFLEDLILRIHIVQYSYHSNQMQHIYIYGNVYILIVSCNFYTF